MGNMTFSVPRCTDCTVCERRNTNGNLEAFCGYAHYGKPQEYRRITGADALKTSPLWCPKRKSNAK